MKRVIPVICIILTIPFLFCSCFNKEVENITLGESDVVIAVGDTKSISATVEPQDAKYKNLTWTSSDTTIVTVNDGIVKGISVGNAVITAESSNGIKKSCNVTVTEKEVSNVVISESSTSVKVGSRIQLTATVQPSDASTDGLMWSSEDKSIATVNSDGFVKGVKAGETVIYCKAPNGKQDSCIVTVKAKTTSKSSSSNNVTYIYNNNNSSGSTSSSGMIFPDSSVRKLTEGEVSSLSSSRAQDAINEIYARNGYVFKTQSIQAYYDAQSWYTRNPYFSLSNLNSIESYNIQLLSKYR